MYHQSGISKIACLATATLIILVAFAGYVAAGPFITMQRIQMGLSTNDPQILENNIDFVSLRASIKTQLNQQMEHTTRQALGNSNPMANLAKLFLNQAVDKIVDFSLTPQGLANLMRGKTAKADTPPEAPTSEEPIKPEGLPPSGNNNQSTRPEQPKPSILEQADMRFDSANQCSFLITGTDGKTTRIIFTRNGLRWKLSDIRLPPANAAQPPA